MHSPISMIGDTAATPTSAARRVRAVLAGQLQRQVAAERIAGDGDRRQAVDARQLVDHVRARRRSGRSETARPTDARCRRSCAGSAARRSCRARTPSRRGRACSAPRSIRSGRAARAASDASHGRRLPVTVGDDARRRRDVEVAPRRRRQPRESSAGFPSCRASSRDRCAGTRAAETLTPVDHNGDVRLARAHPPVRHAPRRAAADRGPRTHQVQSRVVRSADRQRRRRAGGRRRRRADLRAARDAVSRTHRRVRQERTAPERGDRDQSIMRSRPPARSTRSAAAAACAPRSTASRSR